MTEEDDPTTASADYTAWRTKMIKDSLAANVNSHATDHSTIMTNGMHAQKALAYDVAIGRCGISAGDMSDLRIAADWRFVDGLPTEDSHNSFQEYVKTGLYLEETMKDWARASNEGRMPKKIMDSRAILAGEAGDTK